MAPTIVLVPAAFTPPEVYFGFVSAMQKHGLETVVVSLPSVGFREDGRAPGTMSDDAAEIARVVTDLYDNQGRQELVLLTHSYGGIPASESMKFVSTKNRNGKMGIDRIIYLASIVLPVGVSNDEMRKRPPPAHAIIDDDWITTDHALDAPYDFNDLPANEGLAWASKMKQHSTASFRERATYPGYNDVEVHYIRCTNDAVLPSEATDRILGIIEQSSGKAPTVHEFASGHSPPISKPEELAMFVKEILGSP